MTPEVFRAIEEADLSADVRARVQEFVKRDLCPETQAQTLQLLKDKNVKEIERLFLQRLEFGTAGLRAEMGCGFSRINDVTIMQTSIAVADYLRRCNGNQECTDRGVVIGFDGRHNSMRYAHIAAAVFISYEMKVYLFENYAPTPTIPFSVLKYKCVAGIQITASHNPKQDNGYKLYADNGAQIIPPTDAEIAKLIKEGPHELSVASRILDDFPKMLGSETGMLNELGLSLVVRPDEDVCQAYMAATEMLCKKKEETKASDVKIVYTAMHGVGYKYVAEILKRIGFNNLYSVEEQQDSDPEFPSVPFPNPEEPGALSIAIKYAESIGAPIVIANDPDADRFACAEKEEDGWRVFKGDDIGILFGYRMFQLALAQGIPREKMLFICSAVSSRMLQKMAVTEGCVFEETMTGFKWMMNCAMELQNRKHLVPIFVYEEALGYAVSMQVPDKDGVSAAAIWVEMVCELYNQGTTVAKLLDSLCKKYGYFVSHNSYFKFTDKKWMTDAFTKFRNGGKYPSEICGYKIKRIRDVTTGYDDQDSNNKCQFPLTPDSQMITLYFENGANLTVRVSGTEPKLKYYSEMSGPNPKEVEVELKKLVKNVIETIF